jgi:putative lipoprotein
MRSLILALALASCSAPPAKHNASPAAEAPAAEASAANQQSNLARMPSWEAARAAGVDFRAVGQEPGWMIDIYTRGIIQFVWDYGESYAAFAVAEPTYPQEGSTRYQAHSDGRSLVVTIRRAPCEDSMSGEDFPASVEVVIDGRTLSGCGRSL